MMAYRMTLLMMAPGLFAFFFLVFPARSRLDERAPWLKWLLVGLGAVLVLTAGPWRPLLGQPFSNNLAGETILSGRLALWRAYGVFGNVFLGIAVGIVALVGHAAGGASPEVRRKARVLAWGTVAGIAPALSVAVAELAGPVPDWLAGVALFALPLMRLSPSPTRSSGTASWRFRCWCGAGPGTCWCNAGWPSPAVGSSLVVAVVLAVLAQRWLPAGSDMGLPVAVVAAGLLGVGVARAGARVERRITDRIGPRLLPRAVRGAAGPRGAGRPHADGRGPPGPRVAARGHAALGVPAGVAGRLSRGSGRSAGRRGLRCPRRAVRGWRSRGLRRPAGLR